MGGTLELQNREGRKAMMAGECIRQIVLNFLSRAALYCGSLSDIIYGQQQYNKRNRIIYSISMRNRLDSTQCLEKTNRKNS